MSDYIILVEENVWFYNSQRRKYQITLFCRRRCEIS